MRLSFDQSAFVLRIGLGLVFLAGGLAKLSKLFVPAKQADMVNLYLSPGGYINQFFFDYLFHFLDHNFFKVEVYQVQLLRWDLLVHLIFFFQARTNCVCP